MAGKALWVLIVNFRPTEATQWDCLKPTNPPKLTTRITLFWSNTDSQSIEERANILTFPTVTSYLLSHPFSLGVMHTKQETFSWHIFIGQLCTDTILTTYFKVTHHLQRKGRGFLYPSSPFEGLQISSLPKASGKGNQPSLVSKAVFLAIRDSSCLKPQHPGSWSRSLPCLNCTWDPIWKQGLHLGAQAYRESTSQSEPSPQAQNRLLIAKVLFYK